MVWIVVLGVAGLTIYFWQQVIRWANQTVAGWIGKIAGEDVREAFLLILAGIDRLSVAGQRAFGQVAKVLIGARITFQRLTGGQQHQKVVQADIRQENGEVITLESAEIVDWHELPDDVREKFIRRQTDTVQLELKIED